MIGYKSYGSSGGGGHTIENSEGIELEQRDKLQFGEGFLAEDDDTNEKTIISPNVMQSGDMDDVITPLPSVQTKYHKYSTEEHIVGEWIDGSTLYEKTITGTTPSTYNTSADYPLNISNLGEIVFTSGMLNLGNGSFYVIPSISHSVRATVTAVFGNSTLQIFVETQSGVTPSTLNKPFSIIIQYTKTTT